MPPRTNTSDLTVEDMLRQHVEYEEKRFEEGERRMERIEEDLRPIAKMYNAFLGASAMLSALIALMVWIYMGDRDSMKQMGEAIQKQGSAIERMILKHEELERDMRRDFTRVDKELDRVHK